MSTVHITAEQLRESIHRQRQAKAARNRAAFIEAIRESYEAHKQS